MAEMQGTDEFKYKKIDFEYELSISEVSVDAVSLLETKLEKIHEEESVLLSNWHLLNFEDASTDSLPRGIQKGDGPLVTLETVPMIDQHPENSLRGLTEAKRGSNPKNTLWPYLLKALGTAERPPDRDGIQEIALGTLGSFFCLLLIGILDQYFFRPNGYFLMLPAFAAMAVILFSKVGIDGPFAQPPNVVFGHLVSAVIGVTCRIAFGWELRWLAAPFAVALSIGIMSLTSTAHPAAGATAVAAIYGGEHITRLGYWFVVSPVFVGTVITLIMAILFNNLSPRRRYPSYWCMR